MAVSGLTFGIVFGKIFETVFWYIFKDNFGELMEITSFLKDFLVEWRHQNIIEMEILRYDMWDSFRDNFWNSF